MPRLERVLNAREEPEVVMLVPRVHDALVFPGVPDEQAQVHVIGEDVAPVAVRPDPVVVEVLERGEVRDAEIQTLELKEKATREE